MTEGMTTDKELIAALRVAHREMVGFGDALLNLEDRLAELRAEIERTKKVKNDWRDAYIHGT